MEDKFYTVEQVAEILGMHHKTIRKFITEGKLRAGKVGKQWRISGHDLSIFMEINNVNIRAQKPKEELSVEHVADEDQANGLNPKINVSTVVEVNEIDIDQYTRISNTLIAIMNCKDNSRGKSTINVKYYEDEKKVRILLWGQIKFTEEILDTISILVEQASL